RERDVVDRAHDPVVAAEKAAFGAKMLAETDGFEEGHHATPPSAARSGAGGDAAAGAASQHRAVRPAPGAVSGGASRRQRSKARGQRWEKAQPAGNFDKSGGWPSIAASRWSTSLIRGIELSRASV